VLPLLGVGQMTLLHLYPALLVNLFASVMQHLVLARRDQLSLQATQRLEREMQAAQSELRAQQAQLSVTTSFVGMLLHELKNPLASVRLATLNLLRTAHQWSPDSIKRLGNIQAAVDGMDAVLDRCRQVDRLDSGAWTTAKVATDAAGLLADAMARSAAPLAARGRPRAACGPPRCAEFPHHGGEPAGQRPGLFAARLDGGCEAHSPCGRSWATRASGRDGAQRRG
jgi:signal transduction histidine kinase